MTNKEYENQVREFVVDLILKYDGLRKAAKATGIEPSLLSRVKNGKYMPKEETFEKWVTRAQQEQKVELPVDNEVYTIYCKGLSDFKSILEGLGYELKIEKKGT